VESVNAGRGNNTRSSCSPRARSFCSAPTDIRTSTAGSFISRTDHELIVAIPPDEFAAMIPGVAYALIPRNEVPGYEWKTSGRVTITKPPD
jgi:hypothetical protein